MLINLFDINTKKQIVPNCDEVARIPIKGDYLDVNSITISVTSSINFNSDEFYEVLGVILRNGYADIFINIDKPLREIL